MNQSDFATSVRPITRTAPCIRSSSSSSEPQGSSSEDTAKTRLEKLESLISQATREIDVIGPLFASLLSIPVEHRYPSLEMTPERQKEATLEALVSQMEGFEPYATQCYSSSKTCIGRTQLQSSCLAS